MLAIRPRTLPAAASPVLVGSALAVQAGGFAPGPAVAALGGALALQVGSNLANDVYDFEQGVDLATRLGPIRVTQAGMLSGADVKRGMWAAFGFATLIGVYLTVVAGWPVVAIGLTSIAAAIAYTGGPFPLGYHGLGDLFVMVFFGFVAVCGTVFVQVGAVPAAAWPAGLMVGCLTSAILVVNNVRDHETDRIAGKRTLAVILGRDFGVIEFGALLTVAYLTAYALVWFQHVSAWALLSFLTMPAAVTLFVHVRKYRGPLLNTTLAHTAQLLFLFSTLFSAGVVVGVLLR
ncbi:MAG: 1,4-dihydroxy-2-naphthoate polyprenyltransferase, partial [Gemmatimonadota bacterium]|nr:1,4-dihydroxy-2-naphthoate polyprenyltransferase [Gemmatimonadota bacterium]